MARERMSTTSVQLTDEQFEQLKEIKVAEYIFSNAEVLRNAFDFYVKTRYPQLLNN